MKTLLTAAVFSITASFSVSALADTQVFGVKIPVGENTVEVGHTVKGSYVETDHTSFYISPKEANEVRYTFKDKDDGRDYLVVFGVKVPVGSRI